MSYVTILTLPSLNHLPPGALQGGHAAHLPRSEFGSGGRELLIRLLCRCVLVKGKFGKVSESRGVLEGGVGSEKTFNVQF